MPIVESTFRKSFIERIKVLEEYADLDECDGLCDEDPPYYQKCPQCLAREVLNSIGEEVAQLIFEELHGDLTFRSLTNEMLSYFYEHAFVTPKIRKRLGIYYTPPEIARNMGKSMSEFKKGIREAQNTTDDIVNDVSKEARDASGVDELED